MNVEYVKAKDRPWDIYAIINKKNNKVYIGQTTQPLKQRFAQHFSGKTYSAIKRSGDSLDLNDYEIHKITTAKTQEEANELERRWIRYTRSNDKRYGYNINGGGCGNGVAFTNDYRKRIAKSRLGEGNPFFGKHHTEAAKKRMSDAHKGKAVKWLEHAVECVETGEKYESITAAAKATGLLRAKIGDVCRGDRKTTGKLHWRYCDV